jgi:hypothetical protein
VATFQVAGANEVEVVAAITGASAAPAADPGSKAAPA